MAFPRVDYCIVCEDVRPEQNRKLTILGFYGICPHVTILTADIKSPLGLAFILIADRGEGTFRVSIQLKDEAGNTLISTPETDFPITDPSRRNNWIFGMRNAQFPRPGLYIFTLLVDGHAKYEASFEVREGKSDDFSS